MASYILVFAAGFGSAIALALFVDDDPAPVAGGFCAAICALCLGMACIWPNDPSQPKCHPGLPTVVHGKGGHLPTEECDE